MRLLFALSLSFTLLGNLVSCKLLLDYKAPAPVDEFGQCQLERAYLGDHVGCNAGGSAAFIKPGLDPDGRQSLHFHRDANFRRAEVRVQGDYAAGKKYFVGYEFRLSNVHEHLAIFQWKKEDSSSNQNIPFNLQFTEGTHTRLSLGYTPPGEKYSPIWTSDSDFETGKTHNIALAWDTGSGGNSIQMWFDGKSVFSKSGLDLWTGATYPKFGIYRGEKGDHDGADNGNDNVFDSFMYRVQISDASLDEVADSSGLGHGASTKASEANTGLEGDLAGASAQSTPTRRRKDTRATKRAASE